MVVSGLDSAQQRRQESERLINWAFRAFETTRLYKAGEPVAKAKVWIGAEPDVAVAPEQDLIITFPYGMLENAEITVRLSEPVEAPVEAGVVLGSLEVVLPGVAPVSVPLVTTKAVERGGIMARLKAITQLLKQRIFNLGEG